MSFLEFPIRRYQFTVVAFLLLIALGVSAFNGIPRSVDVPDHSLESGASHRAKADPSDPAHLGSSMPGMIVTVAVLEGDQVKKGQKLLVLEAMKMETTIYAEKDGDVQQILVKPGTQVETGDLLMVIA